MQSTTRKRLLIAVTAGVILIGGTAGSCGSPAERPANNGPAAEQPDCDFDDMLEGDEDCDAAGSHSKPKKHKSPAPKTSKAKPFRH